MALQANIDDSKVSNFSNDAKLELVRQLEKYGDSIINESNLIEQAIREDGACTEITSNIVIQAVRKNKNIHKRKSNIPLIIVKIMSPISLCITGLLFDINGYKDEPIKLIFLIIFLSVGCISTVLQFVFEDKE